VEVTEEWRKLQNDGLHILFKNNILSVIKSKENSTVGICSTRGRNVNFINIDGRNPWNVQEESNERFVSTKSVGFLEYSRNPQCSKKGPVSWTAVHQIKEIVICGPVIPCSRFKTVLGSTPLIQLLCSIKQGFILVFRGVKFLKETIT